MWKYSIATDNSERICKISILAGDRTITYSEVIDLWQKDRDFRAFFSISLERSPFNAYFWETPPISLAKVDREFECVLIDSPELARVQVDGRAFQAYFGSAAKNEQIITFANRRKDALLVVPRPMADLSMYSHLGIFIREAPQSQKQALWQTLGVAIAKKLNNNLLWVSTSGLGVYWLHLRLDSIPKYYKYRPYIVEV